MNHSQQCSEISGEQCVPLSRSGIEILTAEGKLTATDRVRQSDAHEWVAIEQMNAQASEPAELNDLSELSFSFDETSVESVESDESDESDEDIPDINAFTFVGNEDDPVHPVDADLPDIDAFTMESGGADNAASKVEPEPSQPAGYFAESLGQVLGPMPLEELIAMAETGALAASDRVRKVEDADWCSAGDIEELSVTFLTRQGRNQMRATARKRSVVAQKRCAHGAQKLKRSSPSAAVSPSAADSDTKTNLDAGENADSPTAASGSPQTDRKVRQKRRGHRNKKRRKKKEDAFLAEIVREVFTADGKVREDREPSTPAPLQQPVPAVVHQPTAPIPSTPSMPVNAAAGFRQSTSPAPPAGMPARAGGPSLPSIPLPDGKVMGIIAGVLVLVGVSAFFLFSEPLPPRPNIEDFVDEGFNQYRALAEENIDPEKWAAFEQRIVSKATAINAYYNAVSDVTGREANLRDAAVSLIALGRLKPEQKAMQATFFGRLQKAIAGL